MVLVNARRYATGVLLSGALALCLAGCVNSPEPAASTEPTLGPLEELFNSIYGNWSDESASAEMTQVEEIIATCMTELGFEYTPVDYSEVGEDAPDAEYGTREFAERYGYGATTAPWGTDEPEQEWVDPNAEYTATLSSAQQEAYWTALYGATAAPEAPQEDLEYNWEDGGCQGQAQQEVYSDQNAFEDERFLALQEELEQMWLTAGEDPRLAELERRWASCMADAGYPDLAAVADAANSIHAAVNAVWEQVWAGLPPEPTEVDYDAAERTAQEQIAAITEREIATAVADVTCRERVDYDNVQRQISAEHQQQFYDSHKEELDSWAADYQTT